MRRLFDNKSNETISPLIDVVMNGFGAMFIILMIYLAIARVGGSKALTFLEGYEPPHAIVGVGYLYVPPAVDGSGERSFSLLEGDLADWGLAIDPRCGAIHGVPSPKNAPNDYPAHLSLRLRASDSVSTADLRVTLTVHSGAVPYSEVPVRIARRNPVLPTGRVAVPWECVIGDARSTPDVAWEFLQSLPPGIDLDSTTGRLHGTPTAPGSWQFTLRCERASGSFAYRGTSHGWSASAEEIVCRMTVLPAVVPALHFPTARVSEPWAGAVAIGPLLSEESISYSGLPEPLQPHGSVMLGSPASAGSAVVTCVVRSGDVELAQTSGELLVLPAREPARVGRAVFHVWAGGSAEFDIPCAGLIEPVVVEPAQPWPDWVTVQGIVMKISDAKQGSYELALRARDGVGHQVSGRTALIVASAEPLRVPSPQLVPILIGHQATWRPLAAGGSGPLAWSMEPPSLAGFASADGFLRGQADSVWTKRSRARVTDPMSGSSSEAEVTFMAVHPEVHELELATTELPPAVLGRGYRVFFAPKGGVGIATFEVAGTLPPGLTKTAEGLSGKPTNVGSWPISIKARDESGRETAPNRLALEVRPEDDTKPRIQPYTPPVAIVSKPYSMGIVCTGGVGIPKITFRGGLPAGLTFSAFGITGTPTQAGSFDIEANAVDTIGQRAEPQKFRIDVIAIDSSTPRVSTTALQPAPLAKAYTCRLAAEGGFGNYEWLLSGDLPQGLTRNGAMISGAVEAEVVLDEWPLRVRVRDEAGNISPEVELRLAISR